MRPQGGGWNPPDAAQHNNIMGKSIDDGRIHYTTAVRIRPDLRQRVADDAKNRDVSIARRVGDLIELAYDWIDWETRAQPSPPTACPHCRARAVGGAATGWIVKT